MHSERADCLPLWHRDQARLRSRLAPASRQWITLHRVLECSPRRIVPVTDNIENLILEHLRAIRADVGQIKDDLATVKQRLTSVETQIAHLHGDNAIVHARIDSMEKRLERIEKRLDLTSV